MKIPEGLLCSKTNEYVINCGDYCLIGMTNNLIEKMGNIVFVEFPEVGSFYTKKEVFATVEADGAASELYMPVAGTILEINPVLNESLDSLNNEPLSDGWLIKVEPGDYNTDIYDLFEYKDINNENY